MGALTRATLVAAAVIALLAPADGAQAHNYLVSSTPAADSTITELPTAFSVTTNEPMLDLTGDGTGFLIEVTDAAGRYYGDGCFTVADGTLSAGATLGEAGLYRFVWQVVSEDGHTVSGEFAFTWAPTDQDAVSPGSATPPVCGAVEPTPTASAPATATPEPATEPIDHPDANLTDVLWIGGAIVAVLLAALVTVLIVGRRARRQQE